MDFVWIAALAALWAAAAQMAFGLHQLAAPKGDRQ